MFPFDFSVLNLESSMISPCKCYFSSLWTALLFYRLLFSHHRFFSNAFKSNASFPALKTQQRISFDPRLNTIQTNTLITRTQNFNKHRHISQNRSEHLIHIASNRSCSIDVALQHSISLSILVSHQFSVTNRMNTENRHFDYVVFYRSLWACHSLFLEILLWVVDS